MTKNTDGYSHFEAEMNRGFLQVLVLAALEKKMYGYLMVRTFHDLGYVVEENTLYPLLRRLERNGLILSEWDVSGTRPKKFYRITGNGRKLRKKLLSVRSGQDGILNVFMKEMKND